MFVSVCFNIGPIGSINFFRDNNLTATLPVPNEEIFIDVTCTHAWSRGVFARSNGGGFKYESIKKTYMIVVFFT